MKHTVNVNWKEAMSFETEINGHTILLDADERVGGKDKGPRPKPLILSALAGCTAMDVVSILGKMKVEFTDFRIEVEATMTDEHPKYYDTFKLVYIFTGKDLPEAKLKRAVELSQENYCGVSKMVKSFAELDYEIKMIEA